MKRMILILSLVIVALIGECDERSDCGHARCENYRIVPAAYRIVHFRYGMQKSPWLFSTAVESDTLYLDLSTPESLVASAYANSRIYYPEALWSSVEHAFTSMFPDNPKSVIFARDLMANLAVEPYAKADTMVVRSGNLNDSLVYVASYEIRGLFYETPVSDYFPFCSDCLNGISGDSIGVTKTVVPVGIMYIQSPDKLVIHSK